LPDERREIMLKIRTAIANNLPIGFEECIRYGMIGWSFRKRFILRDITAMQSCMNGLRMLGLKSVEETLLGSRFCVSRSPKMCR
jgi:hypothetical protein